MSVTCALKCCGPLNHKHEATLSEPLTDPSMKVMVSSGLGELRAFRRDTEG